MMAEPKGQSAPNPPEGDKLEPTQTPEPGSDTPTIEPEQPTSEKFKGKTAAEIEKAYQELESQLGKQGEEFGKIKEERDAYQTWYQQQQMKQQQSQQTQQPSGEIEPNYDDFFLEKPKEAFDKRFEEKMKTEREKIRYETSAESAYRNAPFAKQQAKTMYPDAFNGITDQELDQIMYGGVQARAISPLMLGDPNSWAGAAGQLQLRKRGFKFSAPPPNPMNPPSTETPTPRQPTEEEKKPVKLRADSVALAQAFGKSEKEAAEIVGKARKEREGTGG